MRFHRFDEPRMGNRVVARLTDRVMAEIARRDLLPDVADAREAADAEARSVPKKRRPEIE